MERQATHFRMRTDNTYLSQANRWALLALIPEFGCCLEEIE